MTEPLSIGAVGLARPVVLAPMSGVTDWPFRRLAREAGCGLVVSEMVASAAILAGVRSEMRKLSADARAEFPFSLQLAGWDPATMAEAARIGEELGAAVIDINMGCPARKVTGRLSGSALMRDEGLAGRIFAAVRGAVSVPVTVKMRLGWDDASRNAPALAAMAEGEGLAMVAVHGRTRCQFFKGAADWGAVAGVREATGLPLFVNGDIASLGDVDRALALSGADGVMVGRAAVGRPWFLRQVGQRLAGEEVDPDPGLEEVRAVMRRHLALMLDHYGGRGLRLARKHIAAYTRGMGGSALMRQIANNNADAAFVFGEVDRFFDAAIARGAAGARPEAAAA